jgi:hypothetical protein
MHICYARAAKEQKLIHLAERRALAQMSRARERERKRKLVVLCVASKLLTHGFFFEWNQLCNGAFTVAPSACIVYQSI